MNESVMDRDPSWMRDATEDELRAFVKILDEMEDGPRQRELLSAFNCECDRRSRGYYEGLGNGEWI